MLVPNVYAVITDPGYTGTSTATITNSTARSLYGQPYVNEIYDVATTT